MCTNNQGERIWEHYVTYFFYETFHQAYHLHNTQLMIYLFPNNSDVAVMSSLSTSANYLSLKKKFICQNYHRHDIAEKLLSWR